MGSGVTPPLSPPEAVQPLKKATYFVALVPLAATYCSSTPSLAQLRAPCIWRFLNGLKVEILSRLNTGKTAIASGSTSKYGQASRPISTGKLQPLLAFHIRPINLVVYEGPLGDLRPGIPHLGVGFPLICFQRLSHPHIATRPCGWRHNRNTSGAFFSVLSY